MGQKDNIPKIIHYFWFGNGKLPEIFNKCIESWKKYCPDYEIKKWDESNFDINICNYVKEAYQQRKYAFVSDYARCYVIEKYGGIYLDIDVEIIRNIDCFLNKECFLGFENNSNLVNPGLIFGAKPHNSFAKKMVEFYNLKEHFEVGTHTICTVSTDILKNYYGLKIEDYKSIQHLKDISIYPPDYFCAFNQRTNKVEKNENTYSIHHYNASWLGTKDKLINVIRNVTYKIIGEKNYERLKNIKNKS